MAADKNTQLASLRVLRQWLDQNGGFLTPNVDLDYDLDAGVHCRASSDLQSDTTICTCPHSIALSSLNALVDDSFPAFRNRGLAVEAIGYFFLMHQYIHKEKSFWKPYLDTLPGPDHEHRTPFWCEPADLAWLEDTDVLHTTRSRQQILESHYKNGVATIHNSGIDTQPYTWQLFLWAVTIFTSRSFSSRALRPQDSKYWTAYKTGSPGRRQTVLMDMTNTSPDDLDFPVLFPVLDIPNHAPGAKVSWSFDPGRFSMTLQEDIPSGTEVFNNYGPKRNDELLLGYGFCIPDNPHEKVLLTLRPPPESLQHDIRRVQAGYFDTNAEWSSEKATFGIDQLKGGLFEQLPEPLIELLLYMIRHERGLPFTFIEHPLQYIATEPGRQYLPQITRMIVQSLLPKLAKLQSSTPTGEPSNNRQRQARIYREGQIKILEVVTLGLRNYLRSLLYPPNAEGPMIVTLEGLFELLRLRGGDKHASDFLNGIAVSAGTTILEQLCEAGWEDDAFVLLLCFVYTCCEVQSILPEYLHPTTTNNQEIALAGEELERAQSAMELVRAAAEACPGSFWQDSRWSEQFIAGLGGRMIKYESFVMMVPTGQDTGDARLVIYIHG